MNIVFDVLPIACRLPVQLVRVQEPVSWNTNCACCMFSPISLPMWGLELIFRRFRENAKSDCWLRLVSKSVFLFVRKEHISFYWTNLMKFDICVFRKTYR